MPVSRPSRHEIAAISAGKDHTLARLRTGEVLGWGGAGSGRMSTPDRDICSPFRTTDAKPVYVAKSSRYADVSAGYGVSLGISDTRQTLIWGFCQVGLDGKRGFTGWGVEQEKKLLLMLNKLDGKGVKFALSNVLTHKNFHNDLLKNWIKENNYKVHKIDHNYTNSNYHTSKHNKETTQEVLVINY